MTKFLSLFAVLALSTLLALAQKREVTGKITDASGSPIPGATVRLKGDKKGVSADANGNFKISVPPNAILLISGISFEAQEIAVGSQEVITIALKQSSSSLSEVVVTALGISREKKSLNYSAQSVNSANIANSGRANLIDDINGKVSGVQITNSGGQAGAGTTIVIRGYNSLTGNNQPLYVVDGVPIDNSSDQAVQGQYNIPSANRAIDLNPDDVESLTVLKGGAATALYGIQAANGAIVITTKSGKSGKPSIELGYGISQQEANKYPTFSHGFMRGSNGGYSAATTNNWGPLANTHPLFPTGAMYDLTGTGVPVDVSGQPIPFYDNNYKNFFVKGMTNKENVSVSGGGDKGTYYFDVTNLNQDAIVRENTYNKTSFTANIAQRLTDRLKIDVKFNYINTGGLRFDQKRMMEALGYYVNVWDITTFPWKSPSGQETWWQKTISSPMWTVHETGEHYKINRYIPYLGLDYKIARDWSLGYKAGVDNYTETRKRVDPIGTLAYSTTNYLGGMGETRINSFQINSDVMLNYDHKFGDDFKIHALVGQNIFYKTYDLLDVTGNSFVLPNLYDVQNTQTQTIYHNSYKYQRLGVYGDLQLSYRSFLYLEGTVREDWSSSLPRNDDHFLYPSVTAGFIFSELVKTDWLSYGKLRASYAGTANDAPIYGTSITYGTVTPAIMGNVRYSYPTTANNPNIKPEFTHQSEVGVDLGFFKQKVYLEATYYSKRSIDEIIYAPTSYVTGVTSQLINLGETTNKGVDATLTFKDLIKARGFSWTSAFNLSHNVSKVVKVGDNGNDKVALLYAYWGGEEIDAQKGQSFGAIYGYAWNRYNVDPSNPNYLKAPLLLATGENPGPSASKVLLGNTSPKFILGWNNTLSYRAFSLGFTLEWRHGGDVINDAAAELTYMGKSGLTQQRYYGANWVGANSVKTYVGVDANGKPLSVPVQLTKTWYNSVQTNLDETYIEDASWLRLRNVYLSYSIPEKVLRPTHIKGVDLTIAGRNVWLKTKYTGIDPEVSSGGSGPNGVVGIDAQGLPATKSFDFAIKIKF